MSKSNFKFLITGIIFIAALVFCINPAAFAQETVTIDILTVNDFHGALLEEGKNPGAAKLALFLKTEKARNPNGTLILSAGDMFQGTAESNMLYGQSVLEVMNEIGFEAMAIGNHEFDWGIETLNTLSSRAAFPFLTANIINLNPSKPLSVEPYALIEKSGVKIGIIALTTTETAMKSKPSSISGLAFEDLAKTVNTLVPSLKKQGAQIIIVLGHIGSKVENLSEASKSSQPSQPFLTITGEAADLAGKVKDIDAIISGHTHLVVAGKVNEIPIVQAGYWGKAIGKISLTYSKEANKVIESKVSVLPVPVASLTFDVKVKNIVDNNLRAIEPIKNEKLGIAVNELSHSREECSVLGQWASDVVRKSVKADIAFLNGGGLRANIPQGDITVGSLYKVVPFDNTLVALDMTGEQIMKVLEYGIYNKNISMLQYSGLNVFYDGALPDGKGILAVTTLDGKKLDLNKTYRVATIDFLVEGGDGFGIFKEGKNIVDTHILERSALIDFVKSKKLINFKGDGRFRLKQAKAA